MTLQAIRAFYEVPLIDAYNDLTPKVPVYVDNQRLTDTDALSEYVLLRLSFGLTTETTLVDSSTGTAAPSWWSAIAPRMQAQDGDSS